MDDLIALAERFAKMATKQTYDEVRKAADNASTYAEMCSEDKEHGKAYAAHVRAARLHGEAEGLNKSRAGGIRHNKKRLHHQKQAAYHSDMLASEDKEYDAAGAFAAIKAHHLKGDLLKIFLEVLPRETVEGLLELMPGNDAITKELERRDKPVKWADPSDFRF
jgi:hypothetical protein